jgi:hypothetical protein
MFGHKAQGAKVSMSVVTVPVGFTNDDTVNFATVHGSELLNRGRLTKGKAYNSLLSLIANTTNRQNQGGNVF